MIGQQRATYDFSRHTHDYDSQPASSDRPSNRRSDVQPGRVASNADASLDGFSTVAGGSPSIASPPPTVGNHAHSSRHCAYGLVAVALLCGHPVAHAGTAVKSTLGMRQSAPISTAVVGTTPTAIQANFAPTVLAHLRALHASGGDAAVYNFFWRLSAFQLYEFETVYNQSPHPSGVPATLLSLINYGGILSAPHSAFNRLLSANLLYNTMSSVPGGRRAVMKIGTIAGFPAQTTLYEVYLEYATLPGVSAGEAVVLAIADFALPLAVYFGGGYYIGSQISWFIQTYDPALQVAIGDLIGATIANISLGITIEAQLEQDIAAIDTLGSPGLNDVDFDGFQLGAITTAELLPD